MPLLKTLRDLFALCSVISLVGFTNLAHGQGVEITSVRTMGSGCHYTDVGSTIHESGEGFTLIFDNFLVESTKGERRKNCLVKVNMMAEGNWQYAFVGIDYRGYAFLGEQAKLTMKSLYKTKRGWYRYLGKKRIQGPFDDNFSQSYEIPGRKLRWSRCYAGKSYSSFKVLTKFKLRGKDSFASIDSLDGAIPSLSGEESPSQNFRIIKRRCR